MLETGNSNSSWDGDQEASMDEPANEPEEETMKDSNTKAKTLKKQIEDSEHDNQRLLLEKEELEKQLNTSKEQYERTLSSNRKVEHLLESHELMTMEDAETLKQTMSRELHKLNDLQEAKTQSCADDNALLSQMLRRALCETDALHKRVFAGSDTLGQHIVQQLHVLKDEVVAVASRHDKDLEDANQKREHAVEQLESELARIERTIKQLKVDNDAIARDKKDKDKQMRRLKDKMGEQEKELASHLDTFQSIQSKLDAQVKAEQAKTHQLQASIDKLKRLLEKRKTEKQEATDKKRELEREKNQFVQDQTKELEKDLRKRQTEKIDLQRQLAQKVEELRKAQHTLEREKDEHNKHETALATQSTQIEALETETQQLQHVSQEMRRNPADHSQECKRMLSELKPLQQTIAQLTKVNANLHKSLREKGQKEKELQDREKQIIAREKTLDKPTKKSNAAKSKAQQRKTDNDTAARTRSDTFASVKPTWDPLFQYRTLFPFPWLSIILLFLLFLSLVTN